MVFGLGVGFTPKPSPSEELSFRSWFSYEDRRDSAIWDVVDLAWEGSLYLDEALLHLEAIFLSRHGLRLKDREHRIMRLLALLDSTALPEPDREISTRTPSDGACGRSSGVAPGSESAERKAA